jgi:hypothetical protein
MLYLLSAVPVSSFFVGLQCLHVLAMYITQLLPWIMFRLDRFIWACCSMRIGDEWLDVLQRDGCPKIINLGSAKTDLFYERKKYGFKPR